MPSAITTMVSRRTLFAAAVLGISSVASVASAEDASSRAKAARSEEISKIEHEAFSIELKPLTAKVGQPATVTVSVKAKGGFHLNQEYPHKLKVAEVPAGVRLEKTDLSRGDASLDEGSLTFTLAATPEKAGRYSLAATLKTSVCDEKQCILKSEKLTLRVVAK